MGPMTPLLERLRGLSVALAASAVLLAACSGLEETGEPDAEPSETGHPAPYDQMGLSEDLEMTEPGAGLDLGETATVAWEPRSDQVGVLEITVDRVRQARWRQFQGWSLDRQTRQSTPYFVDATVTNVGEDDLGDTDVPLYLLDDSDTLIQASEFKGRFKPCPSRGLPDSFESGDEQQVCLVYLAPQQGTFQAISFRPTETFEGIRWTGDVTGPRAQDQQRNQQRNQQGNQQDGGD